MSASPYATILAEQGPRVLTHQVLQDDPERQWRVIRGLALNAYREDDRVLSTQPAAQDGQP